MKKITPLKKTSLAAYAMTSNHSKGRIYKDYPKLGKARKMNCPPCPRCDKGHLLPFSFKTDVYEFWKCSDCTYRIDKK